MVDGGRPCRIIKGRRVCYQVWRVQSKQESKEGGEGKRAVCKWEPGCVSSQSVQRRRRVRGGRGGCEEREGAIPENKQAWP